MSQKDGFASGFVVGSLLGSLVGGVIGALFAARANRDEGEKNITNSNINNQLTTEASIEVARQSLEDKIAQLNFAIDDVRQQLESVNPNQTEIE